MSNDLIFQNFKAGPAAIFGGVTHDDDLGAGIQAGFAVVGYRGKTWSVKHKGNEIPITGRDAQGDVVPLPSLELVIVAAPNHLSKVFYETGWSEDASAPPDCASSDGHVPDANVPKRQNDVCLTCRWNAFNSKPVQAGQTQQFKGKACSDNKRLAVVPLGFLRNEQYGGPMLLRVPPASLADLNTFAAMLKQMGFPYYAAGIKVSFDMTVSYPKFVFKPVRPLTEEEGEIIMEFRDLDLTSKIIHGDMSPTPPQVASQPTTPQQAQPDNVVPMQAPQQPPPQQAAEPVRPTGFGGGAAPTQQQPAQPTQAPQQSAPEVKTAAPSGFGGGNGQAQPAPSGGNGAAHAEPSGVAQFDSALDKKLEGLI